MSSLDKGRDRTALAADQHTTPCALCFTRQHHRGQALPRRGDNTPHAIVPVLAETAANASSSARPPGFSRTMQPAVDSAQHRRHPVNALPHCLPRTSKAPVTGPGQAGPHRHSKHCHVCHSRHASQHVLLRPTPLTRPKSQGDAGNHTARHVY